MEMVWIGIECAFDGRSVWSVRQQKFLDVADVAVELSCLNSRNKKKRQENWELDSMCVWCEELCVDVFTFMGSFVVVDK